jgi:FkbM family methyltransferase
MASGTSDGKHHIAEGQADASVEVEAVSLDSFWQSAECPHRIVIDIEGHELAALEGAAQLIRRCKPHLILEHHGQAAALEAWLCAQGYDRVWSDPRHTFALS